MIKKSRASGYKLIYINIYPLCPNPLPKAKKYPYTSYYYNDTTLKPTD